MFKGPQIFRHVHQTHPPFMQVPGCDRAYYVPYKLANPNCTVITNPGCVSASPGSDNAKTADPTILSLLIVSPPSPPGARSSVSWGNKEHKER